MKFDPQKHHHRSIRLKEYDYTQPGGYFITIITFQRECLFGEIVNGEMSLSKFGLVAKHQWEKLPKRFPRIEAGAFVVMPNHAHGVIQIVDESRRGTAGNQNDQEDKSFRRAPTHKQFGEPVKGSIPTIVRSYKSAVAYRINLMRGTNGVPVWQRNYYEHIIRNHEEWDRIHRYIESNPSNWAEDNENPFK
jgi:REP element-mobilizing transposase RayT